MEFVLKKVGPFAELGRLLEEGEPGDLPLGAGSASGWEDTMYLGCFMQGQSIQLSNPIFSLDHPRHPSFWFRKYDPQ